MQTCAAKERLRKRFLERRREMNFEDVWTRSALIQENLVKSPFFKEAGAIALYSSIQNEVLTDEIFAEAKLEKKAIYYPRVFQGSLKMLFLPVASLDELSPGAYDIKEPPGPQGALKKNHGENTRQYGVIDPAELDLIIIPGVAFDLTGARLGFGKGFYDRVRTSPGCRMVALAYEFQIRDFIPTESFDIKMNAIITEKRIITASGQ